MAMLWMNEFMHHFETMGNHCSLEFTGKSSDYFFPVVRSGFRPSTASPSKPRTWGPRGTWQKARSPAPLRARRRRARSCKRCRRRFRSFAGQGFGLASRFWLARQGVWAWDSQGGKRMLVALTRLSFWGANLAGAFLFLLPKACLTSRHGTVACWLGASFGFPGSPCSFTSSVPAGNSTGEQQGPGRPGHEEWGPLGPQTYPTRKRIKTRRNRAI